LGVTEVKGAALFSHIFVSVNDFDRALKFYSEVMHVLGNEARFCEREKPWAGWHSEGRSRPYFVICKPYDGEPHQPGNGQMVAFLAKDRKTVQAAYEAALRNGGTSEGLPGLRPEYHANYYGTYFRDPEGNKLCVASHGEE
jgi:catechol 2,3-dioxygenase-like lactoylglutathione lyase family enzyme